MSNDILHLVSSMALEARRIEIFTGAGMSAESGLETYRDEETGVWTKVDPQAMASISAWNADPDPMWAWYRWRSKMAAEVHPNSGHRALAEWASFTNVEWVHITTQNIDNLHERAGSPEVTHVHGSLFEYRCTLCSHSWIDDGNYPDMPVARLSPPRCDVCGGLIRPGVVWFGESLPEAEWSLAEDRMASADLVVIVGTSGIVYPAAALPTIAARRGTPIVEITPQRTELSALATVTWLATAGQALPQLIASLRT